MVQPKLDATGLGSSTPTAGKQQNWCDLMPCMIGRLDWSHWPLYKKNLELWLLNRSETFVIPCKAFSKSQFNGFSTNLQARHQRPEEAHDSKEPCGHLRNSPQWWQKHREKNVKGDTGTSQHSSQPFYVVVQCLCPYLYCFVWWGLWHNFATNFHFIVWFKMRGGIVLDCWGFIFVFGRVITWLYILLRYCELITYAFQFPNPSHQCSITLICVRHSLFVVFISSIAIDKRVRFVIIALNSPSRLSSFPESMMTFNQWGFHTFFSLR